PPRTTASSTPPSPRAAPPPGGADDAGGRADAAPGAEPRGPGPAGRVRPRGRRRPRPHRLPGRPGRPGARRDHPGRDPGRAVRGRRRQPGRRPGRRWRRPRAPGVAARLHHRGRRLPGQAGRAGRRLPPPPGPALCGHGPVPGRRAVRPGGQGRAGRDRGRPCPGARGAAMSPPNPLDFFDLDHLLSEEERLIRDTTRGFVADRVLPEVAGWFERGELPRELAKELGELGLLGMHLEGYGCAGTNAVSYGLACLELEAGDSGARSFVSVQGSLAMYPIWRYGSEEQKRRWLPPMAAGEV